MTERRDGSSSDQLQRSTSEDVSGTARSDGAASRPTRRQEADASLLVWDHLLLNERQFPILDVPRDIGALAVQQDV